MCRRSVDYYSSSHARSSACICRRPVSVNRWPTGTWRSGATAWHETVRSVVEAHAAGRIDLGPVPEDTPNDKVRWAPSFVLGVPCSPGERRPRPYTAGTVAAFLRWTKARGADKQPQRRVIDALSALELIERHILNEKRFNGLRAVEAQKVIPDGRAGPTRLPAEPPAITFENRACSRPRRPVPVYSGSTTRPTALWTTLPTTLPTALARGLLAPRRSTVTSNSSHHAV